MEPRLGIATVRNRLLEIAVRRECQYLAFVDDDEVVTSDWLNNLLKTAIEHRLDLVGGPVRPLGPPAGASRWQAAIWASLARRSRRIDDRALSRSGDGRINKTVIVTGNWLGRIEFLKEKNLRFDERLGFSGGEDTKLYHAAVAAGARTGWAANAVVYEAVGAHRLCFRYQFVRARDQTIASFRTKFDNPPLSAIGKAVAFIIYRGIAGVGLTFACLLRPSVFVIDVARSFGSAAGCVLALLGRHSDHYRNISRAVIPLAVAYLHADMDHCAHVVMALYGLTGPSFFS
jgi:GT2 family glycosyltransferase